MSNIKDTDEIMIDAEYVPNNSVSVSEGQIEETIGIKKLVESDNEEEVVKPKFRPATFNELNVSLYTLFQY